MRLNTLENHTAALKSDAIIARSTSAMPTNNASCHKMRDSFISIQKQDVARI